MAMHTLKRLAAASLTVLAVVVGSLVMTGCEPSTKDHLRKAKAGVLAENPDKAREHLEPVLEAEPDNFEAKRLMAQVHRLNEDFAKAEEKLQTIWSENGFDKEGEKLETEQKQRKQLLEDDFSTVYKEWADTLDGEESPEKFEEVVTKGLEIDPNSNRLNTLLVDFYQAQGERLVEQGKKQEAADTFEKVLDLRTMGEVREKMKDRVANLRFEAHKEKAYEYFNETAKPELVKDDRYDEENKAVKFEREFALEKIVEDSGQEEINLGSQEGQNFVRAYALKMSVKQLIKETTGLEEDFSYKMVDIPSEFKISNEDLNRKAYELEGMVPVDSLLREGYEIQQELRRKAEKAAEKKEATKDEGAKEGEDQGEKAEDETEETSE
ncbi:MAG: tetratricopeptide repeat protein [Myxococcota bacterium]